MLGLKLIHVSKSGPEADSAFMQSRKVEVAEVICHKICTRHQKSSHGVAKWSDGQGQNLIRSHSWFNAKSWNSEISYRSDRVWLKFEHGP